ncbi:chromosome segregation protein SMC [Tersicoccus phoenicis]|uniref:Chromosome partition protein Smc n=1 Tax=Tersicoccus phoenicis TaxID=554083 RepID=A0A1R1LL83_9MICC|nr:chromosome segregation protein SMC [Tersicoccus phoenicis]OMH28307.1 chromosome segregation protein SMC [Tersicoccus phoenicis]
MHLKTLTVRGFKSFASATTFQFEPGVTAVVGPNGSGKSNVVDALAWVMGEQGAKTLRGGKMEDVIFAGTSGRPPLGRAQVSLTIDNTDGALPIEYTEVTISRTLFRSGGSEYAINGATCRLLDIQELLSDSGLGRQMHVIVGQGQLDAVLHATGEDRRGFIEEAAGILKHRRRKEKTVRKLEAMQANLTRLTDLTGEIRRQLTPLGKQAAVARRAQQVQFEVRDAKARLLADELVTLTERLATDLADEEALRARRAELEARLEAGRTRQGELETAAARATPALNAARDDWYRLSSLRDRFIALAHLADERRRLLGSAEAPARGGRDPDQLEQQAAAVRAEEAELGQALDTAREALTAALDARARAEADAAAEDKRLTALMRAAADRREGIARLTGAVGAVRTRVESAEAELGRLREMIADATARAETARSEFAALEGQVAGVEEGEEGLDAAYEQASAVVEGLQAELESAAKDERDAERERDALTARVEALQVGLDRRDGGETLRGAVLDGGFDGVVGGVAELVGVAAGYEPAIAAALGTVAEALAVTDHEAARRALDLMRDRDAGRVDLLVTDAVVLPALLPTDAVLPDGALRATSLVRAEAALGATLDSLLADVVVVPDPQVAAAVLTDHPRARVVTEDGDVFTVYSAHGGAASEASLIELQAAIEESQTQRAAASARWEQARFAQSGITARLTDAQTEATAALDDLHASDARLAAVAERLAGFGSAMRSAEAERTRLEAAVETARATIEREQAALAAAVDRLAAAQRAPEQDADVVGEPDTDRRDELAAAATAARAAEMEARLAVRSTEEQLTSCSQRAQSLERAARAEKAARAEAEQRARRRRYQAGKALAVGSAAVVVAEHVTVSLDLAAAARDAAEQTRARLDTELTELRGGNEDIGRELAQLVDSVHRDELARERQRTQIEAVQNRAADELGLSAEHLIAEYGPDVPVPVAAGGDSRVEDKWAELGPATTETVPFVREEQAKRLRKAERDLAALGKVNPLALEEFAALEERHRFLAGQLEDLKASRADLLQIITEVDRRVQEVFGAAFADTAAQFEHVFARLFPGGEGRLVLTDPDDLLATGVEIEARPAGKKVKRLSLLSGGERSLTAVALLVAIFMARPSPFYVMDEVEAALDDTNLQRLIGILEELQASSQLIIITHQKRTMEIADALYGVSMRGDGVSAVISQRIGVLQ